MRRSEGNRHINIFRALAVVRYAEAHGMIGGREGEGIGLALNAKLRSCYFHLRELRLIVGEFVVVVMIIVVICRNAVALEISLFILLSSSVVVVNIG